MPKVRTFEGTLAVHGPVLVIDKDHERHHFSEPGTPALVGCRARVTTHDEHIEHIEMLDEDCPYTYVGPVESIRGTFAIEIGTAGTKMAGVRRVFFDAADGERFGVLGESSPTTGSVVTIRARKLSANMPYAARETERDIWIQN